ncbi:MAG: RHS repeat domain-containing protein [Methylophagaceae bacterium]
MITSILCHLTPVLKQFCRGLLAILLLSMQLSTANAVEIITYYHTDVVGSPIAATDENGSLLWYEQYKPYGERLVYDTAATNNPLGFTSKTHDDDTGLSYFGARYYDPIVGRFMGVDPVGFQENNIQSVNRYAYANNNPYKYVDPDGEFAVLAAVVLLNVAALIYEGNDSHSNPCGDCVRSSAGIDLGISAGIAKLTGKTAKGIGKGLSPKDSNKMNHLFGKESHSLDDFLTKSGNKENAYIKIKSAADKLTGKPGEIKNVVKNIDDYNINIRVKIMSNGKPELSTAFIKK